MANEQIKKIKTTTINVDDDKLEKIRSSNQRLNEIVSSLGSAHIRRKELEDELKSLEEQVDALEDEFKDTNSEMRKALSKLEKEYPRGSLELQTGVLTINEEVEED